MEHLDYSQQDALLDFTAAYLDPNADPRQQPFPHFHYPHHQQQQPWQQQLSLDAAMDNEGLAHAQQHAASSQQSHQQHHHNQQQQQHTCDHQHHQHQHQQYLPQAASASSQHRHMLPQQSTISHQQQQPHHSRPSSNHAQPAPINLQTAGLNMDYASMMPTDWQFQFQQAAVFQAQQHQQQQTHQHYSSQGNSSLPLNTYNLGAFAGQLQASPVDFMPVSAAENYAAATTGMSTNAFMSMAGPMESINSLAYQPLDTYQNDLGNSFTLSLQNALNQQAADSAHSSVPGSSPTGTILEVQSLSDNEWSAINFNPHRQSLDSFSGTVSNPSQNLHIRTNSDSSSDGPHSASYLSGSYEEIPPWPLSSPHDEFHSQDYIDSQYLQSQGFAIAQERGQQRSSPNSSLAVSPTAGAVALSYASAGSSSTSPTSSGPTSPPLRRRKSPSESTSSKVTKTIVKKSPTCRKDSTGEKKIGRRRGPLRPDQRQQAHEIRKLRACLRCKFLKKTCDKGEPCGGCRPSHARLWQVPCTRLDIKDIGYFMKDWKADYERHVSLGFSVNNIKGFSTMERTLYITHGYGHYLPINAREVFVREDKCFDVDWIETETLNQYELTTAKLSAGMEGVSSTLLSEYLDRHLDQGFENFVDDYFEGTAFITEILKTAYRYYEKEKTPSIRKALKLVLAYNLTVHITLVEGLSDEEQFVGRIDDPASKFSGKTVAPVMINFQVKCALADMWRELQKDILEELSSLYSSVYSGDKLKNWPTIFMLAAILLAIWEEMQFDCHYRVPDEQAVNKFCDDMETTPVGVIVGLFQAISTKLPGLQEWDTSKHHQLLGSNPAICDAMTEVKGHVNKYGKIPLLKLMI